MPKVSVDIELLCILFISVAKFLSSHTLLSYPLSVLCAFLLYGTLASLQEKICLAAEPNCSLAAEAQAKARVCFYHAAERKSFAAAIEALRVA